MENLASLQRSRVRNSARKTAVVASLPAPVGGWNARDPLSSMSPDDAISLENYWPLPYDVMLRKGYTQHKTGLPTQVESLMPYNGPVTKKLFAASSTAFYDVTSAGAVGAAVVTGLTNAKWEDINITTSGGSYLLAVNGTDRLRGYDGTNWWTDGDGTHDITGLTGTTSTITNINLFKNRVWLIQGTTLKAWYLPVNSIAGVASAIDLQSIVRSGGHLVAMGTWTIDAGFGVDDFAAFITSEGEIAVFRGTDPDNAVSWALAGVWNIGPPFSSRCMMKYGGDLLVLTYDGLYPLAEALQSSRLDPRVAITNKIYSAISDATTNYGSNTGWDIEYYAKANMLFINIPVAVGAQQQFAMNTITKAWTNFTGIYSNCWCIFSDEPYFGGNAYVGKFWNAWSDNSTNIVGNAKQAFNYFGMRGATKRWTMMRPTLRTNGTPTVLVALNTDFADFDPTGQLSFSSSPAGLWDSALWDQGLWGASLNISNAWQGVNGQGYCAAVRLKVASAGIEIHWAATDLVMEKGSVL